MALRVLLVLPIREGHNYQVSPDLGILYLGTALQSKGFDVTLLDCPKEKFTFRDFKSFVEQGRFDVVGCRCYSRDHNYVNHHLNIVKQINPDTLTLVGGPHPSALPEFVLQSMQSLDFAWKAEAEDGLPRLLSLYCAHGRDLPEERLRPIPGLVWKSRRNGDIIVNPNELGADLDSFGIPAWELLRPETYPGFIWDEYYPIYTTRGCPYPCTYCNAPSLSGRRMRHRSVEHVIAELTLLKQRYGVKRFSVIDDEFTMDRRYAARLCQAMIDARLNLKWDCPNGVRLDSLYPDLLQRMEAAGCVALAVGIESGNDRIQSLIKKKVTVAKIRERAAMIAHSSNIKLTGYFMIGFLDEQEHEIRDTLRLALSLPLVRANFNIVIPVPGTAIFEEALREGRLKLNQINWDNCASDKIAFERNHVDAARLVQLQSYALLRFYGRPRILASLARESFRNPEIIRASVHKLKMIFARNDSSFVPQYLREATP
ncbi:MAG: radical SAM protein [Acidobacteria bacterium]|nr:radical SAM protein [Acidobacteriota bacterium]